MAVVRAIKYTIGAELPAKSVTVYADDGTVPNLTTYTIAFKLGYPGIAAVLGPSGITITGNAAAPNLTITPAAGAFDSIAAGQYTLQVEATSGTRQRIWKLPFILDPVVLPLV